MHRDVKGAHILLTDNGEVKLGEFVLEFNGYQWLSMVINYF